MFLNESCGAVLISGLIIVHRTSIIMRLLRIKVATGFFYFVLWLGSMHWLSMGWRQIYMQACVDYGVYMNQMIEFLYVSLKNPVVAF